jgi:hypothetical protein
MGPEERLQTALGELTSMSLRRRPDTAIQIRIASAIVQAFQVLQADERVSVCDQLVDLSVAKKLVALSGYLSEIAVRKRDQMLIRDALIPHGVEGFRWNYRENIRHLVLVFYAATFIGLNPNAEVSSVRHLIPTTGLAVMDGLVKRWAGDWNRAILAMGVRAVTESDRFCFVPVAA